MGHSVLIERRLLMPLFGEPTSAVLARRSARGLLRFLVHFPSLVWAMLGVAVLLARLGGGNLLVSATAASIFVVTAIGSTIALRRIHVGAVLILMSAILIVADRVAYSGPGLPSG